MQTTAPEVHRWAGGAHRCRRGVCSLVSKPKQQCFCSVSISHKREFWSPVERCVPFNSLFKYSHISRIFIQDQDFSEHPLKVTCSFVLGVLLHFHTELKLIRWWKAFLKVYVFFVLLHPNKLSCKVFNYVHYIVYPRWTCSSLKHPLVRCMCKKCLCLVFYILIYKQFYCW